MSIQRCPNEVLDMVFQLLPFQSPDNAPAVVLSTMLTCPRFCAIAKRHLIRVVCFRTAKRVNLFAAYLTQLVDTGAYGKARLPIEYMAVLGKYRIPRYELPRKQSKPEKAAESILPFIISTAAPSLHSLVIFGIDSQYMPDNDEYVKDMVQSSVRFPKLQKLILLEQQIISLDRELGQDPLQHCYPQLTSLYIHTGHAKGDVLALRTLRRLRLDMLDQFQNSCPSPPSVSHLETIIIDTLPYMKSVARYCVGYLGRYHTRIKSYHTFIESNSNSLNGGVVVAKSAKNRRVHTGSILGVWKDIVQGGSGCWEKEWKPTV